MARVALTGFLCQRDRLSKAGPCRCEEFPIGPLGPIDDSETLARLIHSPEHLGKNGRLKPSIFPSSHILTKGLSLIRTDKVSGAALAVFAEAVAEAKKGRTWFGLAAFAAKIPRDIVIGEGRAVCVWEDPTPADGPIPANDAHVLLVANRDLDEADALEIRAKIWRQNGCRDLIPINSTD